MCVISVQARKRRYGDHCQLTHSSPAPGFPSPNYSCAYAAVFSFFLCWMLAAVEFPLSVGVADFCADPNAYATTQLNDPTATYYVACSSNTVSPYYQELEETNSYLAAARLDLERIEMSTNMTYVRTRGWTGGAISYPGQMLLDPVLRSDLYFP